MTLTQSYINELSYNVIGAAIEVHKQLGPGLLESVYQACFIEELALRNIKAQAQVRVPVFYKGKEVSAHMFIDILIDNLIVVELKSVEQLSSLYEAQLLTYMKLTAKPKGLLINFNSEILTKNIKSLVNDYFQLLPKDSTSFS